MSSEAIDQIDRELRRLSPEKLAVVLDFVSYLAQRESSELHDLLLMSETALRKEWDTPEEDEAWADL